MKTIIKNTCCPYCKSKNLKVIGIQKGNTFDLELANCENKKCNKDGIIHTFATKKIIKIAKIKKDKKSQVVSVRITASQASKLSALDIDICETFRQFLNSLLE